MPWKKPDNYNELNLEIIVIFCVCGLEIAKVSLNLFISKARITLQEIMTKKRYVVLLIGKKRLHFRSLGCLSA